MGDEGGDVEKGEEEFHEGEAPEGGEAGDGEGEDVRGYEGYGIGAGAYVDEGDRGDVWGVAEDLRDIGKSVEDLRRAKRVAIEGAFVLLLTANDLAAAE